MTKENTQIIQEFVSKCSNEIKKEEIQLSKKKQYQIMLKDTITHIANVIYNEAAQEQLKEYENINISVQETMGTIENVIKDIMQVEKNLNDIQNLLQDIKANENEKLACVQIISLQNELSAKEEAIEKSIQENKTGSIIRELNNISDKIALGQKENNLEKTMSLPKEENMQSPIKVQETEIQKEEIKKEDKIKEKQKNGKNILVISERTEKVYLPYTQSDIDYYMKNGFETEEEIAQRFFTVSLKKYSNFAKSRVKERIQANERTRKKGICRVFKICNELKRRKEITSCNNNSL